MSARNGAETAGRVALWERVVDIQTQEVCVEERRCSTSQIGSLRPAVVLRASLGSQLQLNCCCSPAASRDLFRSCIFSAALVLFQVLRLATNAMGSPPPSFLPTSCPTKSSRFRYKENTTLHLGR
jgi:hypothetical protein